MIKNTIFSFFINWKCFFSCVNCRLNFLFELVEFHCCQWILHYFVHDTTFLFLCWTFCFYKIFFSVKLINIHIWNRFKFWKRKLILLKLCLCKNLRIVNPFVWSIIHSLYFFFRLRFCDFLWIFDKPLPDDFFIQFFSNWIHCFTIRIKV